MMSGVLRALAAAALACLTALPAAATCPEGIPRPVTATAIEADGTLVLGDGERLRLMGVALPQTPALAGAVRERLAALIGSAGVSAIAGDGDRYGRRAALLLAGGGLVQEELVAAGLARAIWLPGEAACFSRLLAGEAAPRAAGAGIWSVEEGRRLSARDPALTNAIGRFAIIAGRVVSVNRGAHLVFVDFGRNYRSDFTIMMSTAIADRLTAEGHPVDDLVGRSVEVRGMVEESGGPAIRLNDAAEIVTIPEGG